MSKRVNDPEAAVYSHPVFSLARKGPLYHVSRLAVWRGWMKHGIGSGNSKGDIEQMPGVFFLKGPKIVRKFIHRTIADEPDYLGLARARLGEIFCERAPVMLSPALVEVFEAAGGKAGVVEDEGGLSAVVLELEADE